MKSRKKKLWIIIASAFFTLFILLPAVAVGVVKWFILPPEKLTPLVLGYVNPMVDGEVSIDRIEVTFWKTFPQVGLSLTGGEVVSYACRDSLARAEGEAVLSDTLLTFSKATVTVQVMDYFKKDRITVERLLLEDPFFYGFIDTEGRSNWDLLVDDGKEKEDGGEESSIPVIDLQRIAIRNGHFIYEDRPGDMYTEVAGFNLRMRNKLRKGNLNIDLKTGFESLIFDSPAYTLENDLSLRFESKLDLYRGRIEYTDAKLTLNGHPFTSDGQVEKVDDNLILDIMFGLKVDNLAELLAFVPEDYLQNKKKITTKGSLSIEGKIDGMLGDSSAPNIRLLALLDKASLKMKGSPEGIEKLDAEIGLYLNGNHPDSSAMSFRKLDMVGTNTSFTATGRVSNLLTNPYVDAKLNGNIDFEGLLQDIINPDSFVVKGAVNADIEAKFRVWEIMDGDFTRLNAAGKFDIDRMVLADRAAGMSVFARGVRFTADTTRQESSYLTNDDLISATLKVDTMSIRYGTEINTRIGKLDVSAKTSKNIDTTTVVPVTTHIRMENMRTRLPDSVWVSGYNIYLRGGIKASDGDRKKGVFGGSVTLDTLKYFDVGTRTRMAMLGSTFNLQIMPLREAMRQRAQATRRTETAPGDSTVRPVREPGALRNRQQDTTARAARGERSRTDSARHNRAYGMGQGTVAQSPSMLGDEYSGIFRNWEIKGSVKFESMRAFTGMFPLPVNMTGTTLRFDTDKIELTNARMKLGKSDLVLNGEVNDMRRALLFGGVFKGNLTVASDYIDCNQLMRAMNQSIFMADTPLGAIDDEEAAIEQWDNETAATEVGLDEEEGLFLIPANIDLALNVKAKKVDFQDVNLENIDGEIIVRNQSVNLRKLKMDSEIGSGNVTMVYTTKERTKATAAFELEIENIIVERLIGMFPSIDSLVPMLRSFEGVLDCQMTAMCELDSMMNVVFPSLETACYLSGENMVLMDGETFAEISKKLMFKNKDRNLIDYISVDLHVKDNKVEVYPFLVELDRYKLAVGGIHNLDMTFDYHVSVLKSPVPFKLGLDIKGDLDDFKFKVVKCKYKSLFKVAREEELQQTRLNLRSAIRESIASQLAANAPELRGGYTQERIRSRRPETAVTDMDADEDVEVNEQGEVINAPVEAQEDGNTPEDPVSEHVAGEDIALAVPEETTETPESAGTDTSESYDAQD